MACLLENYFPQVTFRTLRTTLCSTHALTFGAVLFTKTLMFIIFKVTFLSGLGSS